MKFKTTGFSYADLCIDLEGTLFTDRREERMELLKQRKCLVVITTSRNKSGGIHTKDYETRYGFHGTAQVLMRSEEDMTCTDPELLRIINPICESHKTGWMDEKLFAALDAYSRRTNKLVVIIYDWSPIYKFNMVQSRPTIVVNSSMIATGIGEVIGEGHKLSDVINKYKDHSQLKTHIPKNLYVKNPESLRLYHVSPVKLTELKPRVTSKPMDKENFGIARISAAPTVDGCFRGVGAKESGRYQVYRLLLTKDSRVVKPTTKLVPDRDNSDEYWVLTATKVKNIGYVDVTVNEDGSKSFDDHVHE